MARSEESITDSDNILLSASMGGSEESTGESSSDKSNGSQGFSEKLVSVSPLRSVAPKGKVVIVGRSRGTLVVPSMKGSIVKKGSVPVESSKGKSGIGVLEGSKGGSSRGKSPKTSELRIPTKSCICNASGWIDCSEKFVMSPPDVRRENYFRVYGPSCSYRARSDILSDEGLKNKLGSLEYINKPCFFDEDMLHYVRYAFQIPADIEIRIPEDGERIYCRSNDLWVGIPLEHFRAGLRLPLHRFIHTLLVEMRLGLGQLGPNSIRKICAFIARCTDLNLEPTLSLFWSLHKLQASRNYSPLFEIHWKEGKALGGCLVDVPSSNKGWHGEFLMFRGADLGYLPEYRNPDGVTGGIRRSERLMEKEKDMAKKFAGGQVKGIWSDSQFRKIDFLYNHNLLLRDLVIPKAMDKSRILWLQMKKALREGCSQSAEESRSVAEPSVGTASPLASKEPVEEFRKRKRTSEEERSHSGKKQLRLIDEGEDVEQISPPGFQEGIPIPEEEDATDNLPLSVRFKGAIPTEGKERCTLICFEAAQGWLGSSKEIPAPVGALSAFELSPDKKSLEKASNEDALTKTEEAFGVFGTRFMDIVGRLEQSEVRVSEEKNKTELEKQARKEAMDLMEAARVREKELTGELTKANKEKTEASEKISSLEESLQTEKAMSENLRTETDRLKAEIAKKQSEIEKITGTLERVEKEANITYNDCVAKFVETQNFVDMVEEKAGEYHEIGYNDCLTFIGVGNAANLELHSIEKFRHVEIARLEKEKIEAAEKLEEARRVEEERIKDHEERIREGLEVAKKKNLEEESDKGMKKFGTVLKISLKGDMKETEGEKRDLLHADTNEPEVRPAVLGKDGEKPATDPVMEESSKLVDPKETVAAASNK